MSRVKRAFITIRLEMRTGVDDHLDTIESIQRLLDAGTIQGAIIADVEDQAGRAVAFTSASCECEVT